MIQDFATSLISQENNEEHVQVSGVFRCRKQPTDATWRALEFSQFCFANTVELCLIVVDILLHLSVLNVVLYLIIPFG